ncbi:MAG: hypothetical protein PVF17_01185 [Ignavibacteria bacterium]|jgi:hypothetical protein
MTGKATLLVIAGFSLVFLVISHNFGSVSNRSVDNYVDYYNETISHSIAVSGANMAANNIYLDPTWDNGYRRIDYQNGELDVFINIIDPFQNIREIVSVGEFNGITSTVRVTLAPSKFSKFAYYSVSEGGNIWWTKSDTVWGPFHTQDYMRVYRHPVFYGKATTKKSLIYYTSKSKDKPYFYGGFEQGVDLPLPGDAVSDIEPVAVDNGLLFTGQDTVYMTFDYDSLKYKYSYRDDYTTVYLPDAAPNGVIFAKGSTVRLQGVLTGQYSVVSSSVTTYTGRRRRRREVTTGGTIYLDNDIVFHKDPRTDPTSTDLLGIIAEDEVLITDNSANRNDINIHASIFCENGGFGAEDYNRRPESGNINLLGGIIQNIRRAVGTFNSRGTSTGFNKRYMYDDRLMVASPPAFPGTGSFEIVSWQE